MAFDRRNMLKGTIAVGVSPLYASLAEVLAAAPQSDVQEEFDRQTYEFWTSQVSQPSKIFAEEGRLPSARGASIINSAEYLYYSPDTGFVRAASTDSNNPLLNGLMDKGDASVLISIDAIRPSDDHLQKMVAAKNGSLRVDMKQGVPMQQLYETLNWSAIASLFPDAQFSGYHDLSFDPKNTWGPNKRVPLPGGVGFWSWNFSTQPKPSIWSQVMQKLSGMVGKGGSSPSGTTKGKGAARIANMVMGIGLPAIASTALQAFNQLFGSMQASSKTEWIIHNTDTPLLASKDARQKNPGRAIALKSGAYVVVDEGKADAILSGKYELTNGFIVPSGTNSGELDAAAKDTLKTTSYIALSAVVQSMGT
jgi:hypothetical protein